ncbi:sulfurtransferase [Thiocapsa sp. UBA6158]|jgi:thiosulfate/3-mercaptopyruvate sulfurtransferase|uniref:sulfurtransferase n=1 Tax=Thiocapsa sp. UBA6158 TaxID=1947692 RepID=UPI0025E31344|nr:sulfurtransferase [Thiocapsa sp. UBA6158]
MRSIASLPRGLTLATALLAAQSALALEVPGPLVDTAWVEENQNEIVILDARKDIQSFIRKSSAGEVGGVQACGASGSGGGVSGHIPGAALVDWKDYAVKEKVGGIELLDMIPSKADFEKLMQQSGVNQDSAVVIAHSGADINEVAFATRLYWTLKYYGHDNLALLDGGVTKWAAEKRKIEYGRTKPSQGDWQATAERRELLATLDDVNGIIQDGGAQIVDVRTADFYLGLTSKPEKVAQKGHIPGAKNFPYQVLVKSGDKGTTFYSAEDLRRVATELGIDPTQPVTTHCNTGHLASSGWFVMHELLGNPDARLYVGSMNEWAADPSRKASTKAE